MRNKVLERVEYKAVHMNYQDLMLTFFSSGATKETVHNNKFPFHIDFL